MKVVITTSLPHQSTATRRLVRARKLNAPGEDHTELTSLGPINQFLSSMYEFLSPRSHLDPVFVIPFHSSVFNER